jgi:hypothetical protein
LDFGCGFGFLNPKSKLNQNFQKNKKPHPKPNHKIKKKQKPKSKSIKIFGFLVFGKKFLLRHFFGQVLNRKNPSFIRASLLSKECFISPRFCLLEFKITSNLEKYFCGFIHV